MNAAVVVVVDNIFVVGNVVVMVVMLNQIAMEIKKFLVKDVWKHERKEN